MIEQLQLQARTAHFQFANEKRDATRIEFECYVADPMTALAMMARLVDLVAEFKAMKIEPRSEPVIASVDDDPPPNVNVLP
jgi:hypothetical protein